MQTARLYHETIQQSHAFRRLIRIIICDFMLNRVKSHG